MQESEKPVNILLVEDSVTDAELTIDALREGKIRNHVEHVHDGLEALAYLRQEAPFSDATRPDLILLDLNMPRMDGREVLREIKGDPELRVIPVVVLTTSSQDEDILESYGLAANNYIVKPVDLTQFFSVIQQMQNFWVRVVKLPPNS